MLLEPGVEDRLKTKTRTKSPGLYFFVCIYFFRYITSFTSFTVLVTSGMANAARFGA
jgi:hypothetical protein